MASQSEGKCFPCFECGTELPFFKVIESWRPEHSLDGQTSILKEEECVMVEKGCLLYTSDAADDM
eukprot:8702079-Prorocentrum_lima.AAC.1